ncbi:hypothetical protein U1Q18_004562 [Sarracenia purpurea var. burkii]
MKLILDLYKQMQVEGNPMGNYENRSARQILSAEKCSIKNTRMDFAGVRAPLAELFPEEIDRKGPSTGPISTVEKLAEVQPEGSYVIGGSIVGITIQEGQKGNSALRSDEKRFINRDA